MTREEAAYGRPVGVKKPCCDLIACTETADSGGKMMVPSFSPVLVPASGAVADLGPCWKPLLLVYGLSFLRPSSWYCWSVALALRTVGVRLLSLVDLERNKSRVRRGVILSCHVLESRFRPETARDC